MSRFFEPYARGQLYKISKATRNGEPYQKQGTSSGGDIANTRPRVMRFVGMKQGYRDTVFAMFRIAIKQSDGSYETGYYESFTPWQLRDYAIEPLR